MEEIQRVMDEVGAQQIAMGELQTRLNADPPPGPAELADVLNGMTGVANALQSQAGSLASIAQRQASGGQ